MQNSIKVQSVTLVKEGQKIVTYIKPGTKGRTLRNLLHKRKASLDLAKQVLLTIKAA